MPRADEEVEGGQQQAYVVEALRQRRIRRGQAEFLVKWAGYPEDVCTWEPEAEMRRAVPTMVEKLLQQLSTQERRKPRRQRPGSMMGLSTVVGAKAPAGGCVGPLEWQHQRTFCASRGCTICTAQGCNANWGPQCEALLADFRSVFGSFEAAIDAGWRWVAVPQPSANCHQHFWWPPANIGFGSTHSLTTGAARKHLHGCTTVKTPLVFRPSQVGTEREDKTPPMATGADAVCQDDSCAICLETFNELESGTELCVLGCQHVFCYACIDEWFREGKPDCPTCRKRFASLRRCKRRKT
jgi:hypothetical protein